jgi:hypothetical protein
VLGVAQLAEQSITDHMFEALNSATDGTEKILRLVILKQICLSIVKKLKHIKFEN